MTAPADALRVVMDGGKEVEWVATVYPDWTTLQFSDSAFAFNRATGKVYKLPHPDCPFLEFKRQPAIAATEAAHAPAL